MDSKKNVLILYGSAGHGHENAARAVDEACGILDPSAKPCLADALDYAEPFFASGYRKSYLFLIERLPWLWGFFYFLLDFRLSDALVRPVRRIVNFLFGKKLERLLVREQPSVIVCTHFFPLEVVGALKRQGRIRSTVVVVVTDYLPHYFWVEKNADFYAVALPETAEGLKIRGVPESKIRVLGIPIESKFETRRSRAEASAAVGVRGDIFTALVTSGGAGIGSGGRIVQSLLELGTSIQVLTVCGNNRALSERLVPLEISSAGRLKVFGFVKNMDVLMEASDVVIGKSGGLTLTESLSKGKPMIILSPVPGQETRNADCVRQYGAGLVASSTAEALRHTESVMKDASLLHRLSEAATGMARPRAAYDLARWVHSLKK